MWIIALLLSTLTCVSTDKVAGSLSCTQLTSKYTTCLGKGYESRLGCKFEATNTLTPKQTRYCKAYEGKLQNLCEFSCTCGAGEYRDESNTCVSCAAGYFSAAGDGGCTICPSGSYSAAGAGVCTKCPSGSYSAAGAGVCTTCPSGSYSAAGAGVCTTCPVGQGTPGEGVTSVEGCSYTQGGCVEQDVNYWGADVSDAGSSGIDECVDRCLGTAACVSVSLRDSDNHCWLKRRVYGEVYKKEGGVKSVAMKCISRSVENCVNTDTNFPGRDISNAPSSGITECTERCGNTANCVAVSVSSAAHCWLKDRVNGGGVWWDVGTSSVNMGCLEGSVRNCMNYRTNFWGADISHAGSTGEEECVERCRETAGCVSVTLGSGNMCWLKHTANGQTLATENGVRSLNMACLDIL